MRRTRRWGSRKPRDRNRRGPIRRIGDRRIGVGPKKEIFIGRRVRKKEQWFFGPVLPIGILEITGFGRCSIGSRDCSAFFGHR